MTLPSSKSYEEDFYIKAAGQADWEAFSYLYHRYVSNVYSYIAYRVGNNQDSEELVSQTFMKVVDHISSFESRHELSFKAWLFKIAYSVVCDYYRQKKTKIRWIIETAIPFEILPEIEASAFLPDDIVLRKESFANLHYLIGTLSSSQKEIIILHFFGDLSLKEISQVLGLPRGTVDSHMRRGLKSLKKKFAKLPPYAL